MNTGARNTALGYELIAPESGVLLGDPDIALVEVPFQLLVALHPADILGAGVADSFGTSFPIRFDYLDTLAGGNLSVHCHPQAEYMRTIFGWPYTQHETYYLMRTSPDSIVFLGLHDESVIGEFAAHAHAAADSGAAFDIERFVQTFPAEPHQLYLVPAGTPHGSGAGNVVLEISATPYLYSLRFFDWLRRDADGTQRPVHVQHAFRNLDERRSGAAVRAELVPAPARVDGGAGWHDELLGRLPAMFFEVHRLELAVGARAPRNTGDRFHVLNVVSGAGAVVSWSGGAHPLAYAETMVVPAAVGEYAVEAVGPDPVKVVWAVVR
jgi:mannose-6-phosphate isomerase class I